MALAALWLWPALGLAQPAAGGNGFKVGEGRLHLTLDLEARMDSAAGYFPPPGVLNPTTVNAQPSGEALLHFRPGLRLELPSPKLALNALGYVDYVHYLGLLTPGSTAASHLEALADINAHFNKEGQVGVELVDHFQRSDRTRTVAVGAGVLSLFNEVRVGVPIRPGGGAIEVKPEASWGVEFFQPLAALIPVGCTDPGCDPATVDQFDYSNLRAGVQGRWRFLPKTAVVVDTRFDMRSYFQGNNPNALLLHASAGLAGLVSPKIAVTAKVGWAQDFGAVGGGTLVAHLEATYLMNQMASFKGGYVRSLEPVAAYGLFRDDRGYLEGQMLLGGRLTLRGSASFDSLSFQGATTPRRDTLIRLDLGPEYQITPWLISGAGYLLGVRSSTAPGGGLNYSRHEGYVRMTVTY